jgi:hypothetical protein
MRHVIKKERTGEIDDRAIFPVVNFKMSDPCNGNEDEKHVQPYS